MPSTDRTRLPSRSAVRLLPLALALVLGLSPADAAPVDPAQVGTMAAAWMDRSMGFQGARIHSVQPLAWDAAQPAFYLVRLDPGGWILAGGDDALRPVVGWSTQGPVDGGLPPALASHLQDVERAVLDLRAAGGDGDGDGDGGRNQAAWSDLLHGHGPGSTGLRTSPGDVQPMLAAAWGQGSLYNTDCPGDPAGPGGHAFVGCVGVAIAQVLEYWNWPRQGQSVQSYTHETYGVIRVDFHQETYDWDAITPDEINADVKELLYHAGVSVRMNYGPGSSTAQSSMIATGLRSFFRYQDTTRMVWRGNYTADAWRNLLHAELSAGRPVIYRGQGPSGGHAYNVDGVQDSIWFHINWGWSGNYNGHYLLEDLSPGNFLFGEVQGAVIGIAPDGWALNHLPVVSNLRLDIQDGETARFTLDGTDADGDDLSYTVDGQPIEGRVWSWQPRAGKCGTYVFSYRACDLYGCGPPAELEVVVSDEEPPRWVAGRGPNGVDVDTLLVRPDNLGMTPRPRQVGWDRQPIQDEAWHGPPRRDPAGTDLLPAHPNPFNPVTTLPVQLAQAGHVRLGIHNLAGQRVALLLDGTLAAGRHEVRWSADHLASGVYLAVLESATGRSTRLLRLVK